MNLWTRIRSLLTGSRPPVEPPPPLPERGGRPPHDVDFLDEMNRRRQDRLNRLSSIADVQGRRGQAR